MIYPNKFGNSKKNITFVSDLKPKTMKYFYVFQIDDNTGKRTLLGYNLTETEKDNLFYSLGKGHNSCVGDWRNGDTHLRNGYGGHNKKYKNHSDATIGLLVEPDFFNEMISKLDKMGFDVVKKGVIHKKQKVVSYQKEFEL